MNLNVFFPKNLTIQSIENNTDKIVIYLKSESSTSHCPLCKMQSQNVHSTYVRKPLDASILSKPVQLKIQSKKFFCLNSNCKRQIFTERFTGFLNAYRRLTIRLEEVFLQLSLSMSAESLSRFLRKMGYERRRPLKKELIIFKIIGSFFLIPKYIHYLSDF